MAIVLTLISFKYGVEQSRREFEFAPVSRKKCETGDFVSCKRKLNTVYWEAGTHPECLESCWVCDKCGTVVVTE